MKTWQCTICKYIHTGDAPPEKCPVCGADASKFVEITEEELESQKHSRRKKAGAPAKTPAPAESEPKTGFDKIKDLLIQHHAHPVTVHTPNGLLPVVVLLYILAWLFDYEIFASAAKINQVIVILSFPVVIFTGILEWRIKYNGALTGIFKMKILAAALTAATCLITLIWILVNPQILNSSTSWVFIFLNLFMLACAGVAGHIGGKLVFKD